MELLLLLLWWWWWLLVGTGCTATFQLVPSLSTEMMRKKKEATLDAIQKAAEQDRYRMT